MARATTRRTVATARKLRRTMTLPEVLLWQALRRSPCEIKFRRQHPVGPFVLDFYCPAARLGIEIDGIVHDMGSRPERDEARATWLADHGIALLRIPAAEVLNSADDVAEAVIASCRKR